MQIIHPLNEFIYSIFPQVNKGAIKGKTFSGYHILAYYYVSWPLAIPEMLPQLQLPYDGEYEAAKELLESQ